MIIAFIPCRLGSNRLPNKGLLEINGLPSIERTVLNALEIAKVDKVIIATTEAKQDDPLEKFVSKNVEVTRGSEDDVLERFIPKINLYNPEHILRITGDCPVVSYELANLMVESHLATGADLTFPANDIAIGVGSEVYRTDAILRLKQLKPATNYSEYLIYYFTNNPRIFKINQYTAPDQFVKNWRLTLDELNDLELLNEIFGKLKIGRRAISFAEITDYFQKHPHMVDLNINNSLKYRDNKELVQLLKEKTTLGIA